MTTVEYSGWARYVDENRGDQRTQQILSSIGAMLANTGKKQGSPPIMPSAFSPWIPWPESSGTDDIPIVDPLVDGLDI